jgi:hypothetical protein
LTGNRRDRRTTTDVDEQADGGAYIDEARPRGLPAEVMLLHVMLIDERVLETAAERLDLAWLTESVASQTIQDVLRLYNSREWNGPNALLNQPQSEDASRLISELLLNPQAVKKPEAVAADCLATVEKRWVEMQLRENRKRMTQPGINAADVAKLQQQVLDLTSKLRHIAAFLMGKQ